MSNGTSLRDKIIKASTIQYTATLTESKIYNHKDMIPTDCPMINVALSGKMDGGLTPGLTMIAGVSKNYKTGFMLLLASAFLKKYSDGVVLFYDSEFGTTIEYFKMHNINMDLVVHTPVTDIEMLKIDIIKQLENFSRDDHVLIMIDSIGNLASKKEIEDTLNQKSVADMTRAKQLKSLFRMVTPHLTLKDIPFIAINHTYKEIGMYPKDIVGGGTGGFYSSDNIWIVGRQQEKEGDELAGYNFIINVEKSRYVKEKSKVPIKITFENGIHIWSGLFDLALESGHITRTAKGWYNTNPPREANFRQGDIIDDGEFWTKILQETDLKDFIEKKYSLNYETKE